ncbi:LytR C-terminal domain-containing protein [Cellulomonas endophytica]|uniref:LytR C-terminal domain-containing protein n=1 Tax=Cellulomonas endophytica TaxID=2494735 RepID=UPI0010113994|nr:LytR C-terminal domain-containing protein [Cellulomonas endophytica]
MREGAYPYPEDEFDAAPDPDGPRGMHRAPRSATARWWPFVAAALVFATLAVLLVLWQFRSGTPEALADLPGGDEVTATDGTGAGAADPVASDPAAGPTTDPAATAPAPEASAAPPEPTPTPTPTPTPEPDLATPVVVLNATGISGLAAGVADDLEDAGFSDVSADNRSRGGLTQSTVFYAAEDQAATAALVAGTLGLTAVTLSPDDARGGVAVVLLSDPS